MNWIQVLKIIYDLTIVGVCLRIIYDTRTISRTLAYLMLTIFFPVVGAIVYFSFGINYRKRKLYSKKIFQNEQIFNKIFTALPKKPGGKVVPKSDKTKSWHFFC